MVTTGDEKPHFAETIMTIQPIQKDQWPIFFALIQREGWLISRAEQRLYQQGEQPFLSLKHGGKTIGFISGCRHQHQAWIGNLIVATDQRGKGYGARLFDELVAQLRQQGCTSLWLTASSAGQPLYEKRGFVANDTIQRWTAPGLGFEQANLSQYRDLNCLDRLHHHQNRSAFLHTISHGGSIVRCGTSVALLQPSATFTALGPWYETRHHPQMQYCCAMKARQSCPRSHQLVTDVYAAANIQGVLTVAGFNHRSTATLMHWGANQHPSQPTQIALSGLGSFN